MLLPVPDPAVITRAALAIAGVYLLIVAIAWLLQRQLIYFPDTQRTPPARVGLEDVEERVIDTGDGHRVIAWLARVRPGQPTLLYFHGNGGSLAARAERIRFFQDRGIGVLMMTYRGYGGSTGSPSEAANVADAKRAYDELVRLGVPARDIILYGESLGSGVATQVAVEREVAGLVLDAPYTSIVDIGAGAYPWLPVRLLMSDRYETIRHIPKVKAPILIVHGEQDEVVPVAMGRALHAAATARKTIRTIPGAGHNDHHLHGSYTTMLEWIRMLRPRTGAVPTGHPPSQLAATRCPQDASNQRLTLDGGTGHG